VRADRTSYRAESIRLKKFIVLVRGQQRHRGGDRADQQSGEAGPGDLGGRPAGAEVAVGGEQLLGRRHQYQQRGGGLVEEHGERAGEERRQVEVPGRQDAELDGERDRRQHQGAAHVGGDHDQPAPRRAVDPAAGQEREQEVGA
jgi:hypothetical protein